MFFFLIIVDMCSCVFLFWMEFKVVFFGVVVDIFLKVFRVFFVIFLEGCLVCIDLIEFGIDVFEKGNNRLLYFLGFN